MIDHALYIKRCFVLARRASKAIKSNPPVGAVLVHNDIIIGEGYHQKYGEGHAEVNAFANVDDRDKHLIPNATLYVSLEPCSHFGKTPPCSHKVVSMGIPKVVISCLDPTPKVAGKGVAYLREHGVEVVVGILQQEGQDIIKKFKIQQFEKRPYVTLKWAKSKDNYIGQSGKHVWLTNEITQVHSHKLRSQVDAIMIGTNTAIIDNPSLTNRLYNGDNPIRIVFDRKGILSLDLNIFKDSTTPTWVITSVEYSARYNHLKHVKPIEIDHDENLESLLKKIYKYGVNNLLVEGGAQLLKSFINEQLWDEAFIYSTAKYLGDGIKAPNLEGQLINKWKSSTDEISQIIYKGVKKR